MWKVFPRLALLKGLLTLFAALFLSAMILIFSPQSGGVLSWESFGAAFGLATPVTLIFITLVFVMGKWGWLLLWKAPCLGKIMHSSVCPNLNGEWLGEITSSFLDTDGENIKKKVVLKIKADLFGFQFKLESKDGYQESTVVQSDLYKDPRTGIFYLSYIFEASVPIPQESDDRLFEGAAKLELKISSQDTIMKGTYWTNRAWQRGKNTAGTITLCRVESYK